MISALNAQTDRYPIYWLYNAAGLNDTMYKNHIDQYRLLVQNCRGLTEGVNASFTSIRGVMHEYRAWGTGLYNFLLVVFANHK